MAEPSHTLAEPFAYRETIQQALEPDERIVWIGQPRPSRVIRRGWIPILCGCFYLALLLLMLYSRLERLPGGLHDPELIPTLLIALPFLAAGGFVLTKPLRDIAHTTHVYYIITSTRALIFVHTKKTSLFSFTPSDIRKATVHKEPDGSGDIYFGKKGWRPYLHAYLGLEDVETVTNHLSSLSPPSDNPG